MSSNPDDRIQPGLWDADESAVRPQPTGSRPPNREREALHSGAGSATSALWTVEQVASYLGVPKQTVYCWRTAGYGPVGFRVGKHLRWRETTVVAWTVALERHQ